MSGLGPVPRPPPERLRLEHAAIAQERIENAGQAAGERDAGDVGAAAGGDAQGPGPQRSLCAVASRNRGTHILSRLC